MKKPKEEMKLRRLCLKHSLRFSLGKLNIGLFMDFFLEFLWNRGFESNVPKFGTGVTGAEKTIDSFDSKADSIEETKHCIGARIEDFRMEYEKAHAAAGSSEKRVTNFDKITGN